MNIEDIIEAIGWSTSSFNDGDRKIFESFLSQIFSGTGFTEKQSLLAVRILDRNAGPISVSLKKDIRPFLENPKFKFKIRKSVNDRTVTIVDDVVYGKIIEASFPYNEASIAAIRKFKADTSAGNYILWDRDRTAWVFSLNEDNIQFVANLCNSSSFNYSDEFQQLVNDSARIMDELDKYVPMLAIDNGALKILNSTKHMPEIDTDNIEAALFHARRLGVTLWDDNINQYIECADGIDTVTGDFLKAPMGEPYHLSSEPDDVKCLQNIVTHLSPCLIIIPGGSEMVKLQQAYTLLRGMDVPDKNMSVLFRLPTETGKNFNEFVRNQALNGPISNETKVVFVSGKLPKPVMKSDIYFNSVINFGFESAHFTLKEFIKNMPNIVYFDTKKQSRGFKSAKL